MVTEIIRKTWCSVCFRDNDEQRTEATFSDVVQVGSMRRELDLCAEHHAKLIGDLAEALDTYGQPVTSASTAAPSAKAKAAPNAQGVYVCPVCRETFTRSQSLGVHKRAAHGIEGESYGSQIARLGRSDNGS